MKKIRLFIALSLSLVFISPLAAAIEPLKIAIVNVTDIYNRSPFVRGIL